MTDVRDLCPEAALVGLTQLADNNTERGLDATDRLLASFAADPRLHFLKGSLLAALQRYAEAAPPMYRAIELAPAFHIARFQLGLLLLSGGDAARAVQVWQPLGGLEANDSLRLFSEGLQHLAQDSLSEAERLLREGMVQNVEHPLLNNDMQLFLDQIANRDSATSSSEPEEASSETHWLLQVAASRQTKH
jgi:predicted Zn-dependent protease